MPGNKEDDATRNKAREMLSQAKTPIEKMRCMCLIRGSNGIKGLGRLFRIADDNGDKNIDKDEFKKLVEQYDIDMSPEELEDIFNYIDKDNSGKICFEEFLSVLRPPMSEARKSIIQLCFKEMDATGDGVVTIEDLRKCYRAREHQKYKNGEWTEEQVFQNFMKSYGDTDGDGRITWDEYLNYYSGVSLSIDSDAYFDLMMRNAYRLSGGTRHQKNKR